MTSTHSNDLKTEFLALQRKITKIEKILSHPSYQEGLVTDEALLTLQLKYMNGYYKALHERWALCE